MSYSQVTSNGKKYMFVYNTRIIKNQPSVLTRPYFKMPLVEQVSSRQCE